MNGLFDPIFGAVDFVASGEWRHKGDRARKEVGDKQKAPNLRAAAFEQGEKLLPAARFPEAPKAWGDEPWL